MTTTAEKPTADTVTQCIHGPLEMGALSRAAVSAVHQVAPRMTCPVCTMMGLLAGAALAAVVGEGKDKPTRDEFLLMAGQMFDEHAAPEQLDTLKNTYGAATARGIRARMIGVVAQAFAEAKTTAAAAATPKEKMN